ncbi:FAD-dependent oxidoreductase [Chitinibacter bivalviorum]|uniref:FAD-dependent oxidoreductase n=1 Tax=Chitinibacter bivalviorum TaxID=2739434 RepID=A0A7H9BF31_9NEIS|nr:FAD-dependent oxidoreductase [Chitinibacter bivalviorum]QLG86836.1 FAD-dependent oxidoreductase [Chitinibacter bivalviorum]
MNSAVDAEQSEFRPWWFAEALKGEAASHRPPLTGNVDADVCIVGGGYTGLWTAIQLKMSEPQLKIVLLEKDLCGSGASGRNGGCVLTLAPKYLTLKRLFGEAEAARIVRGSEEAVYAIRDFCEQYGIDAQLRLDGAIYTATNRAQQGCMQAVLDALEQQKINSWSPMAAPNVQQQTGSAKHIEGHFSPVAGSVQPALLVRGLARVAESMGVVIYEHTAMQSLDYGTIAKVNTSQGQVRAGKVVLALNAWMASQFRQFERSIAIVSSDMVITEPCPELITQLGLAHGASVCDSRIFVHYYRSTPDGRLMLGKGGNTFAFGGKMLAEFDQPSRYRAALRDSLQQFFPSLAKVKIADSWNGASDRSVTGLPFFGRLDQQENIFYGFGYSGNGVSTCYLGGQILASMVRGEQGGWGQCALVSGPLGYFPPEPIRWLGSLLVRNAIRRKENAEDHDKAPFWIDRFLARFAAAAGKSDK